MKFKKGYVEIETRQTINTKRVEGFHWLRLALPIGAIIVFILLTLK